MTESSKYQLAIINPQVQDNYLGSGGTVTIHTFIIEVAGYALSGRVGLQRFALIDEANVVCETELIYSKHDNRSIFNIKFTTQVPSAYEFEISLYHIDRDFELVHVRTLSVKNVQLNNKFEIDCSVPFRTSTCGAYHSCSCLTYNIANTHEHYLFCTKICRKDVLANFNKKPALILTATDCSLLFENKAMTNCAIFVEDREFLVHKEILAAKSSVFLTMFESEMKEKKENQVTVEDIEAEIFHEFLRYIYTNNINDLNVHAEKLLMVAEKYDVIKLKLICIDEISRSLTVENAVRTLKIADRYSVKCLKDKVMAFIVNNATSVLDTEEYKTLYKSEQSYLLNEIVQTLVNLSLIL